MGAWTKTTSAIRLVRSLLVYYVFANNIKIIIIKHNLKVTAPSEMLLTE